jgi:tetratricopeptide (TPR) repeat protein
MQEGSTMKLALFLAGLCLLANAEAQQTTPAEQRMAAARQQITQNPKKAEAYNSLALALIARAQETGSPDYDRQAAEAIATGLGLSPQDYQLRKAHVALLLDQQDFTHARDEAKVLNQHNPDDVTVHGYLAQAAMALGDDKAAEESAQWMLNMLPFNVPGLLIVADLRTHYGDPEGALEALNRAYAETAPTETAELAAIANKIAAVEISQGRVDAASQMLQRADQLFPGYPQTAKNQARLQTASRPMATPAPLQATAPQTVEVNLPQPAPVSAAALSPVPAALLIPAPTGTARVLRSTQARVQSHPNDAGAYTALGAAFLQRARETGDVEDFQLAEQALNKSLDLVSADVTAEPAYATLAAVYMGEHRFSDALAYAQKALALGSGDLSSFAIVGDADADMGEYERAAVAYSRLDVSGDAATDPHNVYVRDSRTSYLRFIAGDTAGAIRLMQSAVAAGTEALLPPENLAWLYFELGEYESQAGDVAAADRAYLAALNIHPGDYRALAGLAKLRGNQGRYAEAIKLYQSAIAVVPMPTYVAELGDLYTRTGNKGEADKQYQLLQYIGLLGHINQVLHNRDLALFYADHDIKLDEALTLAHKEFEVRHDIYTWDVLAWALYKNGKYQEASDAMENALRPGTRDALLFFHAGMIAAKRGDTGLAKQRMQMALNINPHFHVIYAAVAAEQLKNLETSTGTSIARNESGK